MDKKDFVFKPRSYRDITLWRGVTEQQWQDPVWQTQNTIRNTETLSQIITLTERQKQTIAETLERMREQGKEPMRITPYYASLMSENPFSPAYTDAGTPGSKLDPVFWQSVPTPAHLLFPRAGVEQSMAESERSYGAFYQRYPNRGALFVGENTSCASFCTHCQRTKSLDATTTVSAEDIDKGLFYINYNENIDEVLVTGGDALRVGKERLSYVIGELCTMPHVRCIRIATRVPVTLPMGVTDDMLAGIVDTAARCTKGTKKNIYFMTHVNHFHEITEDFLACISRIKQHGFAIRNQTVLLNHVNADFLSLANTLRTMWWAGVAPYYLLQCHNERGLAHFIVPVPCGKFLMNELQGWISGTVRATYAANLEGGGGKITLTPSGWDIGNERSLKEQLATPSVRVHTWDDRIIDNYEALGRATQEEYEEALRQMDAFIGKAGLFTPCLIIVDDDGTPLRTVTLQPPRLSIAQKSALLGYKHKLDDMPLTNPSVIAEQLDGTYKKSKYCKNKG